MAGDDDDDAADDDAGTDGTFAFAVSGGASFIRTLPPPCPIRTLPRGGASAGSSSPVHATLGAWGN
jgi:hypothetical protein